jgi:hypothetical protein
MKNLEIKKTFSVNGKEYSSKEEAVKALAMEVLNTEIPKGVENVISNAAQIIQALKVVNR